MRNLDRSNNAPAQRSVAHDTTEDAEASPLTGSGFPRSAPEARPSQEKVIPEPPADTVIVKDDTDDGGPLVIKTTDPDLKSLDLPRLEFPGQGVPEEGRSA